jgi:hypothetical protein
MRDSKLLQGYSEDMALSELMGDARIRHIFQVRHVVTFTVMSLL